VLLAGSYIFQETRKLTPIFYYFTPSPSQAPLEQHHNHLLGLFVPQHVLGEPKIPQAKATPGLVWTSQFLLQSPFLTAKHQNIPLLQPSTRLGPAQLGAQQTQSPATSQEIPAVRITIG